MLVPTAMARNDEDAKRRADDAQRSRKSFWKNHKKFKFRSQMVAYSRDANARRIKELLPQIAEHVWTNCGDDDLKSPNSNKPKPAKLSKPAFNIYFGQDETPTVEEINADMQGVKRAAYGMGSGTSSIGLNPETMRIYPIDAQLEELMDLITAVVASKSKEWKATLECHPFNFVGVKVYFSCRDENGRLVRKTVEWHCDITHNHDGTPCSDNSQIPGTPVAILTYGDPKSLWFRRHWTNKEKNEQTVIQFRQTSGSLFVLDTRDEIPDATGMHWRHMSDNKGEDAHGITYSFSFRSVQMHQFVDPTTNRLLYPKQTPKKSVQFNSDEFKKKMETPHYKKTMRELDERMEAFFQNNS